MIEPIIGEKQCSKCGECKARTTDNFSPDTRSRDGLAARCKACRAKAARKEAPVVERWTDDLDDVLRRVYPAHGAKSAAEATGRTVVACTRRASNLGLRSGANRNRHATGWAGEWVPPTQDTADIHRLWQRCDVAMGGERRVAA